MNDDTAVLEAVDGEPAEDRDGLAAELAAAAPRRWWNRGTLALGVLTLLMAGFLGGLQVQKHFGAAPVSALPVRPGGGAFGGAGRGVTPSAAPAAPGTNGTVKLVDGTTIYLQTADGAVVTVKTGTGTAVRTATEATVRDVKAGDSVTVQGAADAAGTVTATTVTRTKKK